MECSGYLTSDYHWKLLLSCEDVCRRWLDVSFCKQKQTGFSRDICIYVAYTQCCIHQSMIAISVIILPTKRHLHNLIIKTHENKHNFLFTDLKHLCIDIDLHFSHYYLNDREKMFWEQTQLNEDLCKIPSAYLPVMLQTNETIYPDVHSQCKPYTYRNTWS